MHAQPPTATESTPTEAAPAPSASKPLRIWRWLRWGVIALFGMLIVVLGFLWHWSGQEASLPRTLEVVQNHLPAHIKLEADGAQGSLRHGGVIPHLVFTSQGVPAAGYEGGELVVTLDNIDAQWDLSTLWLRTLQFSHLHVASATLQDTRTAKTPAEPKPPIETLTLPVGIKLPFSIDTLRIVGKVSPTKEDAPAQDEAKTEHPKPSAKTPKAKAHSPVAAAPSNDTIITHIAGNYRYDQSSAVHHVQLDSLVYDHGVYAALARLEGRAPMNLEAGVGGIITPQSSPDLTTPPLRLEAAFSGTLSGKNALIHTDAQVQPAHATTATSQTTQVQLKADLHPWQTQPVVQAHAQWQNLDLHAFAPAAPQTHLQGSLQLDPQDATKLAEQANQPDHAPGMLGFLGNNSWKATLQTRNDRSGAYDKGRLPLAALHTELQYDHGALHIQQLQLDQGQGGGRIQGQAQYLPSQGWLGTLDIQRLNLGLVDSRFAAAPISGQIKASTPLDDSQQASQAPIDFTAKLHSEGGSRTAGIALDQADIEGRWHKQVLNLPRILVRMRDASLQGSASYAVASKAASGDLALLLPGLRGNVKGEISPDNGQGTTQINASNVQQALAWVQQWPGTDRLRPYHVSGTATVDANWQGGWKDHGQHLQIAGKLNAPNMQVQLAGQTADKAIGLHNTALTVSGTLAQATLQGNAQIQQSTHDVSLGVNGTAGLTATGWQAHLNTPQLTMQEHMQGRTWQATLVNPATIHLEKTGNTLRAETSALNLQISGSGIPSNAAIFAEPIAFSQTGNSTTLRSKGRIADVPLTWIDGVANNAISRAGLTGSMAMRGNWDVELGDAMRVHAVVERSQGDLNVAASELGGYGSVAAGIRTARLEVNGTGGALESHLQWDSSNAGRANLQLNTRLTRTADGGWTLTNTAPLSGGLQANLPRMGIWSVFAPPGWRLRGTANADVRFDGTLLSPNVNGQINADNLGVRSVVDGIEFSQGQLRMRVNGNRLDIDNFVLHGPTTDRQAGGQVRMTGFATWGGGSSLAQSANISLDTELEQLQLFNMTDRQIVLSGKVHTQLQNLRLTMRGDIRANRALIDIPSKGSAGKLDSDVFIKPSTKHPRAVLANPAQAAQIEAQQKAAAKRPATPPATNAEARAVQQDPDVRAGTEHTNSRITPDIQIGLDLGNNFRVRGLGADTRLNGQLTLRNGATLADMPLLTGTITTDRGTYRAYGQDLQVQQGTIEFRGAMNNPALDLRAIRPNLSDMEVGVRIRGTAQNPHVQLFSTPDMPDSEKLSWLVMGKSSAGSTDAVLLQQAALALLSGDGRGITGQIADGLGLDELSFNGGNGTVAGSSVTLGRRFSRNFYMSYEQGLNATMGTLYFFYDINRRLRLRAQAGEISALDLIYTWTFDGLKH